MAIDHSVYFERIMSGAWANSSTGVVELEESDHASPYNVDMFVRYIDYAEDPLGEGIDDKFDPLDEIDDFDTFAELWLFADYIQSNTLANAIMDEIASKADGSDEMSMSKETFIFWWNETDDRPSFANLRAIMVAMLVESDNVQRASLRHELMPCLPHDAQQAVVDEIMRQHRDLKDEVENGTRALRPHLSAAGTAALTRMRSRMSQKVVGEDYYAAYGN